MADLQVEQFSEAIKDFNLPRLIKQISENWEDPRRKQALKILNALKVPKNSIRSCLKKLIISPKAGQFANHLQLHFLLLSAISKKMTFKLLLNGLKN